MKLSDAFKILKYHGLYKGLRRIIDEYRENIYFDKKYNVMTSKLKFEENYNNEKFIKGENKWYQPTYFSPLKKIAIQLDKKIKKNTLIFDLGSGYGKPLIILNHFINQNNIIYGVELDLTFKKIFEENLAKFNSNFEFLNMKVEEINYEEILTKHNLSDFEIIVHNKNSFSRNITEKNLNVWRDLKKKYNLNIYYIFSNPEFEDLFHEEIIFKTNGWHKNFKVNLYKL